MERIAILSDFQSASNSTCESCLQGKMTTSPFVGQMAKAKVLLEIIHGNVCGPSSEMARGGFIYFITFIGDLSTYRHLILMKQKGDSFENFKEFKARVENQIGKSIKALRLDRRGEYLSTKFLSSFRSMALHHNSHLLKCHN